MPITKEQREQRRFSIGSSDVGAILGLSSYRTAYDLWLEKTGQLVEEESSDEAKAGNRFEAGVLDEAEEKLGKIERNLHLKAKGLPFPLAINLDGRVVATKRPVEGKTAGLFGPLPGGWDADRDDGIPDTYIAQCQTHVLVTNTDLCHAPAFLGGYGFRMFEVPRNDELLKIILEQCAAFWECVQKGKAPEQTLPTLEIAKRIRRQPKKVISIPGDVVQRHRDAKHILKIAKEAVDAADAALLAVMGDAEAGVWDEGTVTYFEIERKGYVVEPTTYRSLKHIKKKLELTGSVIVSPVPQVALPGASK